MTTTIEIACPCCKTTLALPHTGHFSCPKCGQRIEVGTEQPPPALPDWSAPKPKAKKIKVNNGLGWWTAVSVIGWLIALPAVGAILFAILCAAIGFTDARGDTQVYGVAFMMIVGIPGVVGLAIAFGLWNWAAAARFTLICGDCRNPTTKHAKLCPSCRADF